jgi:hypothetical protein
MEEKNDERIYVFSHGDCGGSGRHYHVESL